MNSMSQYFSQSFKEKALAVISAQIQELEGLDKQEFFKALSLPNADILEAEEVRKHGSRWRSSEQVFQAMTKLLEEEIFEKQGPVTITEGLTWAVEAMFMLPGSEPTLKILASRALRSLADTDHWYMFEKRWG